MLGVEMDNEGMTPESLKDCLENWKAKVVNQGACAKLDLKPPKVLYTIPTGQNPTSVVVPLERKKEIYKVSKVKKVQNMCQSLTVKNAKIAVTWLNICRDLI